MTRNLYSHNKSLLLCVRSDKFLPPVLTLQRSKCHCRTASDPDLQLREHRVSAVSKHGVRSQEETRGRQESKSKRKAPWHGDKSLCLHQCGMLHRATAKPEARATNVQFARCCLISSAQLGSALLNSQDRESSHRLHKTLS